MVNVVKKFWIDYEKADCLKRRDMVERLAKIFEPFINGKILKIKDKKMRKHIFITLLDSYFEDIMEYFTKRD